MGKVKLSVGERKLNCSACTDMSVTVGEAKNVGLEEEERGCKL